MIFIIIIFFSYSNLTIEMIQPYFRNSKIKEKKE
jgi:hypothetical protein